MVGKPTIEVKITGDSKGLKVGTDEAVGHLNGFKAKATGVLDSVKAHAGQFALAAGASLVAFGTKAVGAFNDLALEAGKFRDVSGASLDEASKWIAVGDDIGIAGDTIADHWNKMNIAIGQGKPLLEEYGIELKKTADGQVDANGTFLNAIDVINGIKDPTKKAEVAAATFGKGWTDMAELIEQGSGTLTTAMGEVSDAQIIDDSELAKAKKYRESMDKLKDSIGDVALEVGEELTPAVSAASEMLAGVAPIAGDMAGFVGDQFVKIADEAYKFGQTLADIADAIPGVNMVEPVNETLYEIEKLEAGTADLIAKFADGKPTIEVFAERLRDSGLRGAELSLAITGYKEQLDAANTVTGDASDELDDYTDATDASTLATDMASFAIEAKQRSDEAAEEAAQAHTDAINEQIEALTELVGGDIAVRDAQREAKAAVEELTVAMDTGELSAEELGAQQDDTATSLINAATAAADYDEKLGNANGIVLDAKGKNDLLKSKLEELAATLAPGSALRQQIQGYIDDLNSIPASRETRVFITGSAKSGVPIHGVLGATGGIVTRPTLALIGEAGPEAVIPLNQTPGSSPLAAGGSSNVTNIFNLPPGVDPNSLVRAQRLAERRGLL